MKDLDLPRRARFARYDDHLRNNEPGLALKIDDGSSASIAGNLVVDVGAGVLRSFDLEFRFERANPFAMPDVWDHVGHFPADIDRHILDVGQDGLWWCLGLRQEPPVDFESDEPLESFFTEVRGFILKQLIYDDRIRAGHPEPWPGSAWAHGLAGHVEWIEEQLGTLERRQRDAVAPYLRGAALAGNRACPCGSGHKSAACHRDSIRRVAAAAKHSPRVREAIDEYAAMPALRT